VSPLESHAPSHPIVEPLDDWVLVQPSMEEEAIGRIVRAEVSDLQPGDIVLVVSAKTVELRDGSKLVRRQHAVARIRE
jgi:hypothetical protein